MTRAQHDKLHVVKHVEGLLRDQVMAGPGVRVREERSRLGKLQVHLWGFEKVPRILTTEEYGRLVARRERATILEELRRAHARGEGIEDVLRGLAPPPPSA